jgi:hypothetical protein
MKRYEGHREGLVTIVNVDGKPLNPRFDLWKHSPSGFEWGYGGSGPAQLALAILADYLRDDDRAVRLHGNFKTVVIADLPYRCWQLTGETIDQILAQLEERAA